MLAARAGGVWVVAVCLMGQAAGSSFSKQCAFGLGCSSLFIRVCAVGKMGQVSGSAGGPRGLGACVVVLDPQSVCFFNWGQ